MAVNSNGSSAQATKLLCLLQQNKGKFPKDEAKKQITGWHKVVRELKGQIRISRGIVYLCE